MLYPKKPTDLSGALFNVCFISFCCLDDVRVNAESLRVYPAKTICSRIDGRLWFEGCTSEGCMLDNVELQLNWTSHLGISHTVASTLIVPAVVPFRIGNLLVFKTPRSAGFYTLTVNYGSKSIFSQRFLPWEVETAESKCTMRLCVSEGSFNMKSFFFLGNSIC